MGVALGAIRARGLPARVSAAALTSLAILVLNLGGGIAQARGLGPHGRGELAVAMLWPTLLAGLGGLGVQEAVAFHTARDRSPASPALSSALVVGGLQTLALAALGLLLVPLLMTGTSAGQLGQMRFYLWILPLYPLTLYPLAHLQGRLALGAFNLARLCVNGGSTAVLVGLWALHRMSVHAALAASLLATAGAAALCVALVARRRDWSWRPRPSAARSLLGVGTRLHAGNVATILTQRADLLALSLTAPLAAVGTYAVATSAGMVAALVPTAAGMVLYPAVARQPEAARPLSLARVLLAGGALTLLAGPLVVGLLPLAVPRVFGPGFARAGTVVALLALAYLLRGWGAMLAAVVRGMGRPLTTSAGQALELGVLVVLLLVLVPAHGAGGAAAAVLAGAATSATYLLVAALLAARLSGRRLVRLWLADARRGRPGPAAPAGDRP